MDRLAWHSTGTEYRRQPCVTAMSGLELAQRLSSLPSGKRFTVLYLTNAGKAFAFPYQAVRTPFDEMRRNRVTNPPRGCRWGGEQSPVPRGCTGKEKQNDHQLGPPTSIQGSPGCAWVGEGARERPIVLKSNRLQSTRRGIAELSSQKEMSQNTNTEPHPQKENSSTPFQYKSSAGNSYSIY